MMRKPLIPRSARGLKAASIVSAPAPIGGWNMRDSEAAMDPKYALWLENWWPSTSDLTLRKGAKTVGTGFPGAVETLFAYNGLATSKLMAASGGTIADVSAPSTPMFSGLSNTRFQHVTFSTPGGTFIIAVNGADDLLTFDGTTWRQLNSTTTPPLLGVDGKTLIGLTVFKHRLWAIQKNTMNAWYLDVGLFADTAHQFPLGSVFTHGGSLVGVANWTLDAGDGSDDYLVFITSEGEVAVYKGTDPTTVDGFALVGVFFVGEPVGLRSHVKFAGDLLILTQTGLFPLSKAIQSVTVNRSSSISDTIDLAFSQAATTYGSNFGWCLEIFPTENVLIANIPTIQGLSSRQFAMNTITGAWTLFSGWDAFCWETWEGKLYFGGLGIVAQAFVDHDDFGKAINGKARTAFSHFGSRGTNKQFTLFRPVLKLDGDATINIGLDVNYEDIDNSGSLVFANPALSYWDSAEWDATFWAGDYTTRTDWRSAFTKVGFCAALRLQILSKGVKVGWTATDFMFRRGSGL